MCIHTHYKGQNIIYVVMSIPREPCYNLDKISANLGALATTCKFFSS